MNTTSITILVLVIFTLPTQSISLSTNGSSSNIGCIESEKQALLLFKQHLFDPTNRLVSWVEHEDCCRRWVGVVCHDVSGHVLELHLQNPPMDDANSFAEQKAYLRSRLGGKINHSLLNLTHLSYLDLSKNDFGGIPIPHFFGSMVSLRYLDLSDAGFGGLIPHQLGNLSNMDYLNLEDGYYVENPLYVENLGWLAGMSQLKYLDMSNVNLSKALDWLQTVNMLPSLKELHLRRCQLPLAVSTLLNPNLSSLAVLNLRGNQLDNTSPMIMSWVFSLKTLVSLDLSDNHFQGPIPDGLQNLISLRHLDLSANQFNSSIPDWFYGFSPLEFLNLHNNNLQGKISSAIGNMTSAISLVFSGNTELGGGGIPKELGNLCNLRSLSLSSVKLSQNISDILQMLSLGCISHGLEYLDLSFSNLFGQLTDHLGYFKNLRQLYLSQNSIVGSIPESLGELPMLRVIDVSYNNLTGSNLPETHSANLTNLRSLRDIGNAFIVKVHSCWIPLIGN
ncbi:hypothetical protein COLO4_09597 [Corchorus olitorius]|uniref:Leucine-rich repeat-containing N-terminal plant-type domain-containing protein n=1 Tax=Corchorus olitorius TaxID=93759 RepID=A0A1R3KBL9_9ROSI|nr:hypothetical protein COLO4_09597 [Corchorus olitorius]